MYMQHVFHFSTGILAGIWPCGVITLIGELYVAEANKTQVYGLLHSIIQQNAQRLSSLDEKSELYEHNVTEYIHVLYCFRMHML